MLIGIGGRLLKDNRQRIKESVRKTVFYDFFKPIEFRMNGLDANGIIQKIHKYSDKDREIIGKQSKFTGNIYVEDISKYEEFNSDAMKLYAYQNLQHSSYFGSARYIEKELTKIGVDLFKGTNKEDDICGLISSGGTESILFAILSFRNKAFRERGVTEPEL